MLPRYFKKPKFLLLKVYQFKQGSYAQAETTQSTDAPQGQGGMRGRGIAGGGRGMGGGGGQGMGGGSGQGRGMGGGGGRRK